MSDNGKTRLFYVSVIRGRKRGLLAGPFETHEEALAKVDEARRAASGIDPWTDFDEFGTCSLVPRSIHNPPEGVLNKQLSIPPYRHVPKAVRTLFGRLRPGDALCCEVDQTEEGKENGGYRWWIEPGARPAPPRISIALCRTGWLIRNNDDLFGAVPQSWRRP